MLKFNVNVQSCGRRPVQFDREKDIDMTTMKHVKWSNSYEGVT